MKKEKDIAQEYYSKTKDAKESQKEICPYAMFSFAISLFPVWGLFLFIIPIINIFYVLLAFPSLIASIILGIISLTRPKRENLKGRGFAIAGIIISALQLIFIIILFLGFTLFFGSALYGLGFF